MKISLYKLSSIFGFFLLSYVIGYGKLVEKNVDLDQKDLNSKKEISKEDKKKEYKTIKAVRKEIRITLNLKGHFEDPDAVPVSVNSKTWSDLKVVEPPTHGKIVRRGDSLFQLDLEKIKKKISDSKHELSLLNLNEQILVIELKRDEAINKIELEKLKRMEKYNREDFEQFKKVQLPYEKKSAEVELKKYEENLSYAMEELTQLRKMYEADDLTEETEEIIIQRTQNDVNRMRFSLEGAKIRKDKSLQFEIPRSDREKSDSFETKKVTLQTSRIIKNSELNKKKLELQKLVEEKKRLSENISKLESDLATMKVHSPIAGTLFVGTFELGKWSGTKLFEPKLKKGGLLKAFEELITICPLQRTQARIKIPEKNLLETSQHKAGQIISGLSPKEKMPARITNIGNFPVTPGSYDALVQFEIQDGFKIPLPGTTCSFEVITYQNKSAVTLPKSSVFKEDHDKEVQYVYVLSPKGKPVKKIIETGKESGSIIEIVSGVTSNAKILKEKPDA